MSRRKTRIISNALTILGIIALIIIALPDLGWLAGH